MANRPSSLDPTRASRRSCTFCLYIGFTDCTGSSPCGNCVRYCATRGGLPILNCKFETNVGSTSNSSISAAPGVAQQAKHHGANARICSFCFYVGFIDCTGSSPCTNCVRYCSSNGKDARQICRLVAKVEPVPLCFSPADPVEVARLFSPFDDTYVSFVRADYLPHLQNDIIELKRKPTLQGSPYRHWECTSCSEVIDLTTPCNRADPCNNCESEKRVCKYKKCNSCTRSKIVHCNGEAPCSRCIEKSESLEASCQKCVYQIQQIELRPAVPEDVVNVYDQLRNLPLRYLTGRVKTEVTDKVFRLLAAPPQVIDSIENPTTHDTIDLTKSSTPAYAAPSLYQPEVGAQQGSSKKGKERAVELDLSSEPWGPMIGKSSLPEGPSAAQLKPAARSPSANPPVTTRPETRQDSLRPDSPEDQIQLLLAAFEDTPVMSATNLQQQSDLVASGQSSVASVTSRRPSSDELASEDMRID